MSLGLDICINWLSNKKIVNTVICLSAVEGLAKFRRLGTLYQTAYMLSAYNIGEIHYHKENNTNGGKQIEFSAESNQFEKKIKSGNK